MWMKKIIKKVILALALLLAVISVIHAICFEVGKVTGTYVVVDAKITYVHEYVQKKYSSKRANGYFTWEYDGVVHEIENEKSNMIDLEYGTKEGDTILIWVNKSNGRFEAINNKYTDRSNVLSAILTLILYIVLRTALSVPKAKEKKWLLSVLLL